MVLQEVFKLTRMLAPSAIPFWRAVFIFCQAHTKRTAPPASTAKTRERLTLMLLVIYFVV